MLFNSIEYLLFFPLVAGILFLLPHRLRTGFLVLASYLFYACWQWPYLFLIGGITAVSYLGALWIHAAPTPRRRRAALIITVGVALSGLCLFKYGAFAWQGVTALTGAGEGHARLLAFVLPVGISFYTLQAVGYVVDVYRRDSEPERSFVHFALFISFFPQLVAGPIERAGHLLAQFRRRAVIDPARIASGLQLILWGLFKKVVIADRLAGYVDKVYADPTLYGGPTLLLATYFFAFQIYCDFSGYSDMAIGSARVMGIDLMRNFRMPYLATSLQDFWRRWHISLSSWFRDYVYIPLGGGRGGRAAWMGSIVAVFVLSGLWHGANMTFIVWGGLHGVLYLVERLMARSWPRQWSSVATRCLWLRRVVTFHAVLIGWVFFRAHSLGHARAVFARLFQDWANGLYLGPSQWTTALSAGLIGLLLVVPVWQQARERRGHDMPPARALCWGSMILLILGVSLLGISDRAFIYFQF